MFRLVRFFVEKANLVFSWGESRVIPKKAETGDEPKTEFRSKILNTDENGYDTYIVKVIFRYRSKGMQEQ